MLLLFILEVKLFSCKLSDIPSSACVFHVRHVISFILISAI